MDLVCCYQGAWQFEIINKKSCPCLDTVQYLVIVHDVHTKREKPDAE